MLTIDWASDWASQGWARAWTGLGWAWHGPPRIAFSLYHVVGLDPKRAVGSHGGFTKVRLAWVYGPQMWSLMDPAQASFPSLRSMVHRVQAVPHLLPNSSTAPRGGALAAGEHLLLPSQQLGGVVSRPYGSTGSMQPPRGLKAEAWSPATLTALRRRRWLLGARRARRYGCGWGIKRPLFS